ncbi:MAG: hypothetical protein NWF07_16565, partial [Candidatus Bathyarchaeota archaeon]|nr:hypothetical protein [Candidatus Bathyarchaeota archaeon]
MKRSLLILLAALTSSLPAYSADSTFIDLDGDFLLDLVVDEGTSSTIYLGSTLMQESVVLDRKTSDALMKSAIQSVTQDNSHLPIPSASQGTSNAGTLNTTSLQGFSPSDIQYEFALRDSGKLNNLYTHQAAQFVIEDVDRDGRMEWLFWEKADSWDTVATMYVYENSYGDVWLPEDTLATPAGINAEYPPYVNMNSMVAADFDQDGYIEVYFEGGDAEAWVYKWWGERNVEIYRASLILNVRFGSTYVVDWEKNGIPNIVAVRYGIANDNVHPYTYLHVATMEYHSILQYDETYEMFVFGNYQGFTHNWGEEADYAFEGAVGDIDNDGQNEIALNRVWGKYPTPNNKSLFYVDVSESGEFEVKEFVGSTYGYNYTPVIADIDNDGINEWVASGVSYMDDLSTGPYLRIIESDENGNLSETFFDTSWAFAPSRLRAATLTNQGEVPTLVSACEWYDPNEVRPDTVSP